MPDSRDDIKYETQGTLQYCRYMNTVLEGIRCMGLFNIARHSGLSYNDSLASVSKMLGTSQTVLRRRMTEGENIRNLFDVSNFEGGIDGRGHVFFDPEFVDRLIPWICNLYGYDEESKKGIDDPA